MAGRRSDREARLAAALRENLRERKRQKAARAAAAATGSCRRPDGPAGDGEAGRGSPDAAAGPPPGGSGTGRDRHSMTSPEFAPKVWPT